MYRTECVRKPLLTYRSPKKVQHELDFGICSDYNTTNGCENSNCYNLHCCSYYIQKACRFNKICKFSHDLKNTHNWQILRRNRMESLNVDELLEILNKKHLDPSRPLICKGYNSSSGCKFGSNCTCLHLCGFYVNGECSYGKNCKRSHDLKDLKVQELLEKHSINVKQTCKAVLDDIKKQCQQNKERKRSTSRDMSTEVANLPAKEQKQSIEKHLTDNSQLICTFYLRNKCLYKENCTKFHQPDHLPYHWQYQNNEGMWLDLPQNRDIEGNYCICEDHFEIPLDGIQVNLNLNDMTWTNPGGNHGKIRRLSTELQRDASKGLLFLTIWKWYWMNDETEQWIDYRAENNYPSFEEIEAAFQEKPRIPFQFRSNHWLYEIDFGQMIQINKNTNKVRKVIRRPDFFNNISKRPESTSTLSKTEEKKSIATDFPNYWTIADLDVKDDSYLLVEVPRMNNEFFKMDKLFRQTTKRPIKTLKRIENPELWQFFIMKRDSLRKKGNLYSTERYLFHGTRGQYVDAICQQGFDFRLNGMSSGTSYGKGSYFARDASYSLKYSDCSKMFVARVIVGEFVKGRSSYTRPPLRDGSKYDNYESCVNDEKNPSIFVIFDNIQAYPEYLVEY